MILLEGNFLSLAWGDGLLLLLFILVLLAEAHTVNLLEILSIGGLIAQPIHNSNLWSLLRHVT